MSSPRTQTYQFEHAQSALREATNLHKARYWASCVQQSYQVVLRAAAGLLYARGVKPQTEREVRVAFAAQFVAPGTSPKALEEDYRRLEKMRHESEFEHDHETSEAEGTEALRIANAFWAEAQRLVGDRKDSLK